MKSHHAPTRRVLENFRSTAQRETSELWVYMKNCRPRSVSNLRKVGVENKYFGADPDGRSEAELETALNRSFESDFHALIPTLLSPVWCVFNDEMRRICAGYVANLFLRSKPLRVSCRRFLAKVHAETLKRLEDPKLLQQYAAQYSVRTGRRIGLATFDEVVRRVLEDVDGMANRLFYQRATTEFSQLPKVLSEMNWNICRSSGPEFLQSDAAVALLNMSPLRGDGTRYGYGASRMGSVWYFPVSPHVCISVSRHLTGESHLPPQRIGEINEFMVRAAVTSVYSRSYDQRVRELVDSRLGELDHFETLLQTGVEKTVEAALVWPHA